MVNIRNDLSCIFFSRKTDTNLQIYIVRAVVVKSDAEMKPL